MLVSATLYEPLSISSICFGDSLMHVHKKEKELCLCGCKVGIDPGKSEMCAVHRMPRDSMGNPVTADTLRIVFEFATGCNNAKCDGCKVKACKIIILDAFSPAFVVNAIPFGAGLGENTFEWDLKDLNGNVVKQGCYIIYVIIELNNGNKCADAYIIHVLECGEIQKRNLNQINIYSKKASSGALSPRARNRAALLRYYSSLLYGVRKCVCRNLAEDLESGKKKNWDEPCFMACITAHIASDIQKEFGSKGSVFLAADKWAKKAGSGTLGLYEFAGFVDNILKIENKIRGEGMSKCGNCNFTQKDESLIIDCIQTAISRVASPLFYIIPTPYIPVPLHVPPLLSYPPAFFLQSQLAESITECKKLGPKKSCSVPQLR